MALIQSLLWGESKVAEYVAEIRKWLATPSQYRERDAPTIETIFWGWHLKTQAKLTQREEKLEIHLLEGELCTSTP